MAKGEGGDYEREARAAAAASTTSSDAERSSRTSTLPGAHKTVRYT